MKQVSLAYALLLFVSLSLAAADAPATAPPPIFQAPTSCTLNGLESAALTEKPTFMSSLQPPCVATTDCADGSKAACPTSYYSACLTKEGCWALCADNVPVYCPGKENDPECRIE